MALREGAVSGDAGAAAPAKVPLAEAALVDQAIRGDEAAFTQLYDVHHDRIYRFLYYRTGRSEDAEDLTQRVFLQAWRALPRYRRGEAPLLAWLYTIARNELASFYRSRKTADLLPTDVLDRDGAGVPDGALERHDEQERIRAAIQQLSPDQRQVVTLRFLEDLGYEEIAACLGKSAGNVRVIQHRALRQLSRLLAEQPSPAGS